MPRICQSIRTCSLVMWLEDLFCSCGRAVEARSGPIVLVEETAALVEAAFILVNIPVGRFIGEADESISGIAAGISGVIASIEPGKGSCRGLCGGIGF